MVRPPFDSLLLLLYYPNVVEVKASKPEGSHSNLPYYTESVVLDADVIESPKCILSCGKNKV